MRIDELLENFADSQNPGRKEIDPDVYEDLSNSIIARIARQIVPTIRAKSTPEGYVYLSTEDGLSLVIGCNIAGGSIDINLGSQPMETASSGPHKGAVTKIIAAVYQAAVKRYGTPTEQGTLSIDHDAGHGVWQHIAQKLGLQYDAHMVKENFANGKHPEEYLYHATYRPLLQSIRAHGLGGDKAQAKWEDSKPGVVYLAIDPNVAESYAESSDVVPEDWLDEIVIIKIAASKLDQSRLFIDQNVQDNAGDTLEYHGVIPMDSMSLSENFADGRNPQDKGDSKRHGINTKASVSSLRKSAKHSSGRKRELEHWLANMKSGHKK